MKEMYSTAMGKRGRIGPDKGRFLIHVEDIVDQFGRTRREAPKKSVACFHELKLTNIGKMVGGKVRIVRWDKGSNYGGVN